MEVYADKKHTIESEMAKTLFKYSYGRLTVNESKELASRFAPVFEKESQKNTVLAHKGIAWFSKEVLKTVKN